MKRHLSFLTATVFATLLMCSCSSIKNFLDRDLEDEDFVIGQLYADEYVKEVPYVPTATAEAKKKGQVNSLGIEREATDNEKLYDAIQEWIGTPYRFGGTTKEGVDCSGFVGHIYRQVYGVKLHRTANDMQQDCTSFPTLDELKEGDILFFTNSNGKVSHVGIYLKRGMFAHSSTSNGVIISKLDNSYWSKHFYKGGRR